MSPLSTVPSQYCPLTQPLYLQVLPAPLELLSFDSCFLVSVLSVRVPHPWGLVPAPMPSPCSPNPLPTSHFHVYSLPCLLPSETPPLAETCSIAPHSCVVFTPYSKPSSLLQHTFPNSKGQLPTVLPVSSVQSLTLKTLSHQQYPTQFQQPLSAGNISFLGTPSLLSQRLPFFSSSPDALPESLPLGTPPPHLQFLLPAPEILPRELPPRFRTLQPPRMSPHSPLPWHLVFKSPPSLDNPSTHTRPEPPPVAPFAGL